MTKAELTNRLYLYRANLKKVVDGDTVDLEIDLGFHVLMTRRVRLLGINAPEKHTPTYEQGMAAMRRLSQLLSEPGWHDLYVATELDSSDKYGRILGRLWRIDQAGEAVDLCQRLLEEGVAAPYPPVL